MGTGGTGVQNDPQTWTYFGAGQVNLDPQMGLPSGSQTPINSHPRLYSSEAVNYATVFPPRAWDDHASLPGHMVRDARSGYSYVLTLQVKTPVIHGRDGSRQVLAYHPAPQTPQSIPDVDVYSHTTPPTGTHICLSNRQTTALLPGPTAHMVGACGRFKTWHSPIRSSIAG